MLGLKIEKNAVLCLNALKLNMLMKMSLKDRVLRGLIEKNFTLCPKRWSAGADGTGKELFKPHWLCNDITGKCKGNMKWAQTYPAGRIEHRWVVNSDGGYWTYDFFWDEKGGPCMNGEVIIQCPYCN
jgi:hypothetical protein